MFDIEANMRDGDSRSGLDEAGAAEVHRIMAQQGVVSDTDVVTVGKFYGVIRWDARGWESGRGRSSDEEPDEPFFSS